MRLKRIEKWVAIELVVAFDTDLERAIRQGPRDAEHHVAIADLTIVQRHLPTLIDFAGSQFGRTGDAAAISASVGQINALFAQRVEQRAASIDRIGRAAAIGDRDGSGVDHSQISLVQSPPG